MKPSVDHYDPRQSTEEELGDYPIFKTKSCPDNSGRNHISVLEESGGRIVYNIQYKGRVYEAEVEFK